METQGAEAATLDQVADELKLSDVNFIKLDVDGYEYPVLAGGRKMLRRYRPTIALELAPYIHAEHGHSLEALLALLSEIGYELRNIVTRRPITSDPTFLRHTIPAGGSINVLAVFA
jgi:hypothetical protein